MKARLLIHQAKFSIYIVSKLGSIRPNSVMSRGEFKRKEAGLKIISVSVISEPELPDSDN
jgi:hypothetical protein